MFRTQTPSLKVTTQTSLADLQRFADRAGDNAKIRGKQNHDGSITIYASNKKGTGLENAIKGKRDDRRALGQDAIALVVRNVRSLPGSPLELAKANILQQLPPGELRGAGLRTILDRTRIARENAAEAPRTEGAIGRELQAAVATGQPDRLRQVTAELGSHMAMLMNAGTAAERLEHTISRGDNFKDQVLQSLAAALPQGHGLDPSYAQAGPELKAVLDEAYTQALGKLPNHQVDENRIVMNGTVYTKDRHLAEGGFGSVDVYRSKAGHEVAVKTPILSGNETMADKFDEAAREIRAHASAAAGAPANVVRLEGAVRTPEGGLKIVMELAGKNSAFDAVGKLDEKVAAGDLTVRDATIAKLTIIKDMIEGMRHVQETRGMTHLDIKGPNFFVDANGITKLGDFGTAEAGTVVQLKGNPIDNPGWSAPELIKGGFAYNEQVGALTKMATAAKAAARAEVDRSLPQHVQDELFLQIKQDKDARADAQIAAVPAFQVSAKADTWSVGAEAFRALTGETPFQADFMSEQREKLVAFGEDPSNRLTLPPGLDVGLGQADRAHLDALISGLLHPDPQQRTSLTNALANPIFQVPGVGGQAARDTIAQL